MTSTTTIQPEQLLRIPPYQHQAHVIQTSAERPAYGLFMEQGTGKTAVGIATFTHLFRTGKLDVVFIGAPNGVQDNWARIEIPKLCVMDKNDYIVATWRSTGKEHRRWTQFIDTKTLGHMPELLILCFNIEALRTEKFWDSLDPLIQNKQIPKSLAIIDESTAIKNVKAQQTRNAIHLGDLCTYRRIMTGTPITQSPLDLYGQIRFLGKNLLPFDTWTVFKRAFAVEELMVFHNRTFTKIVGYKNQDKLAEMIAPYTYRVLKKDCLDLPPKVYETRFVEMPTELAARYEALKDTCVVQINEEQVLTVTTVLTMLLRLQQLAQGYLVFDNGSMLVIDDSRLDSLMDLLEENPVKTIIFCRFVQDIERIEKRLQEIHKEKKIFVSYYGAVEAEVRHHSVEEFQNNPDCLYFIATKAAARGLTLTAAEHVVYYSQDFSLETRLQSEDRAHRSGQTKTVVYTDLCTKNTVDEMIVAAHQNKKTLAEGVLTKTAALQLLR